jgi:hypothetical protein
MEASSIISNLRGVGLTNPVTPQSAIAYRGAVAASDVMMRSANKSVHYPGLAPEKLAPRAADLLFANHQPFAGTEVPVVHSCLNGAPEFPSDPQGKDTQTHIEYYKSCLKYRKNNWFTGVCLEPHKPSSRKDISIIAQQGGGSISILNGKHSIAAGMRICAVPPRDRVEAKGNRSHRSDDERIVHEVVSLDAFLDGAIDGNCPEAADYVSGFFKQLGSRPDEATDDGFARYTCQPPVEAGIIAIARAAMEFGFERAKVAGLLNDAQIEHVLGTLFQGTQDQWYDETTVFDANNAFHTAPWKPFWDGIKKDAAAKALRRYHMSLCSFENYFSGFEIGRALNDAAAHSQLDIDIKQ